ncbi:MAG TPA: alkene reductase [Polyangiaceae bacterium]|nr:alkene reductase [Polyangiaceae bacterium]
MRLFEPFDLGAQPPLSLPNRIVMAPLTRCMAGPGGVPTAAMTGYYARRAAAGLIIGEATVISPEALGYPNVPGLYDDAQQEGWRAVTTAVHGAGGRMFAQLWHTGRAAHSIFSGQQPVAPSAVALDGTLPRMRRLRYEEPRALEEADLERILDDFARAAERAVSAGFDGVELHGANGYLIDQFLHYQTNQRDDAWGGSPERMAAFPLRVVDRLLQTLGRTPLGLRLSPSAHVHLEGEARDRAVFDHLLRELAGRPLAYVHLGLYDDRPIDEHLGERATEYLRKAYPGVLIGVGSYTAERAEQALERGDFALCAFGRPFIANPDLVERLQQGRALEPYDPIHLQQLI